MDRKHDSLDRLEALFEVARARPPEVPGALMARVLADAGALQPKARAAGWRGWIAALGGMPALGGLVTATCVGFWLGVAPPEGLPDLAAAVLGGDALAEEALDAPGLSGFGWDIGEG
ncbi:hypothetical protein AB2B41_07420 [Marimonas sp. MJW-29]|uniref:Dihydroorotate dehydrogenase n=1 Tax=Sulfitobacter sediminis TaxID=3234186 RepID=A0ABV3RL65_9RHOB